MRQSLFICIALSVSFPNKPKTVLLKSRSSFLNDQKSSVVDVLEDFLGRSRTGEVSR